MKKAQVFFVIYGILLLCSSVLSAVTLANPVFSWYSQSDPQWSSNMMGSSSYNLGSKGCAVTCMAMLHQGETSSQSSETNPSQLNSWLASNGGYSYSEGYALIVWPTAANMDGTQGLQYVSSNDTGDNWSYLDQQLSLGNKVVVKVDYNLATYGVDDHWVVVYARNGASGIPSSYSINDPLPTTYIERTLQYYYDSTYDNTFFGARSFSGTWNAPMNYNISLAQNLGIYATRTSPPTIYSLPNEYSGAVPDQDINTYYSFRLANSGSTGVTIADTGVNYYNSSGSFLMRVNDTISFYLASGTNLYREKRVYITDQFTNNQQTTLTGKVAYKINDTWYELSGAGSSASFTVYPRPSLNNTMLVKCPSSNNVYYYQSGYKWGINSESDASLISANWNTIYYVYPNSAVSNMTSPLTPNSNDTIPTFVGRNLIYKNSSSSDCYLIDSDPSNGGSIRSRRFQNEPAYYNYGYSGGTLASQSFIVTSSAYSNIQSRYPVGSEIGNSLTVNPTNINIGHQSGSTTFSITSNVSWTVNESISWLSISPSSGSGNNTIAINYTANPDITSRSGQITVSGSGLTQTVTVTQDAAPLFLTVTPNSRNVTYQAGTTTFDVASNTSWVANESTDWFTVSPMSGSNSMTLTVNYQANPLTTTRTGQITVSGSGLTQTITVTQDAAPLFLTVTPNSRNVTYQAGTTTFDVASNTSWVANES
ncbi:MAG: BACON domain-containing protein, partial [Candidatus Cloacimonetes bacterium]|nr:BACON domain-containing protein [Candidatus Cloacimonadota bacterium]